MKNELPIALLALGIALALTGYVGGHMKAAKPKVESASGISVAYPPTNKHMSIPTGKWVAFDIHLHNKYSKNLVGEISHEGLDNVKTAYAEKVPLASGQEKDVAFHLRSDSPTAFSGKIHIRFFIGKTQGNPVYQSFGIPSKEAFPAKRRRASGPDRPRRSPRRGGTG